MQIYFLAAISLLIGLISTCDASPLFESDETLTLTIKAPMRELISKRMDKPVFEAVVTYVGAAGEEKSISARISPRGHGRLETCDFPPIRLDFRDVDATGTPFAGQGRLKLVNHCGRAAKKESWLLQEYGIYRAYNVITDVSFRVRKMQITFVDSTSDRWTRSSPAFAIEPVEEAALRLGMVRVRPPKVDVQQFQPEEITNNLLFQYLIGNTDFAVLRGPVGEGCCHNGRVVAAKGSQEDWIVLPYDFDQAGIINTDYALPDLRLGIRTVTQRLYRGFCWQNYMFPAVIERFNERRDAITDALIPEGVSPTRQRRIGRYVDAFYATINDPGELREELTDKCRGPASFTIRKTNVAGP